MEDYKEEVGLDDAQLQVLARAADECVLELSLQDARAAVIIKAFRLKAKNLRPGAALPSPPPELETMQRNRDAIVVRHRDFLHALLGDTKFARLQTAAQHIVHVALKRLP